MSNPNWRDDEYVRENEVSDIEDVGEPLVNRHLPGCPAAFSDEGGACRCDDADEQLVGGTNG